MAALASFAGLATSANQGTAFALPVTVLMVIVVLASPSPGASHSRTVLAAVMGLASLALLLRVGSPVVAGQPLWISESPGISQAEHALGMPLTSIDTAQLARDVASAAAGRPLVIVRDDALLNSNTFSWLLPGVPTRAPSFGSTSLAKSDVEGGAVLIGRTPAPYHSRLLLSGSERFLVQQGFRRVLLRSLSRTNAVEVWVAK